MQSGAVKSKLLSSEAEQKGWRRMRHRLSMVWIIVLLASVVSSAVATAAEPAVLVELSDSELDSVVGAGLVQLERVASEFDGTALEWHVSGISGNAFRNASGFAFLTTVSGDGNFVPTNVDVDIEVYFFEINADTVNFDGWDMVPLLQSY